MAFSIALSGDFAGVNHNFDYKNVKLIGDILKPDIWINNLETSITCSKPEKRVGYIQSGSEESLEFLKKVGVTTLNLANNHIYDFGEEGLKSTVSLLERHKLDYFGVLDRKDAITLKESIGKIKVFGYTEFSTGIDSENVNCLSNVSVIQKIIKSL